MEDGAGRLRYPLNTTDLHLYSTPPPNLLKFRDSSKLVVGLHTRLIYQAGFKLCDAGIKGVRHHSLVLRNIVRNIQFSIELTLSAL